MGKLQRILDRFEITIAEANDLVVLQEYEIVIIADDSGSMLSSALPFHMRTLAAAGNTRWDEMQQTLAQLLDIASCFDSSGVDVFFLNRPPVLGVKDSSDPNLRASFSNPPAGRTPLTECLQQVAKRFDQQNERKTLVIIMTDGEPNGGATPFSQAVRQVTSSGRVKVQVMVCTPEDDEVEWLNTLDAQLTALDVTDDYYSEKQQVLARGLTKKFTRGDWCMKAMLGPVSHKFDLWDEKKSRVA